MKMLRSGVLSVSVILCGAGLVLAPAGWAAEATALELARLGNDYVGKESRDQIVQIRSEKSVGTTIPNIWFVVYHDEDATFKAAEVKFVDGKKMKVSRPMRLIEAVGDTDRVFDRAKLKVDSDQAIKIAKAEEALKTLSLRATQLWLQHGADGPVWKVKLWAARRQRPIDDADIGDVFISASDGKVVRSELHINSVD